MSRIASNRYIERVANAIALAQVLSTEYAVYSNAVL